MTPWTKGLLKFTPEVAPGPRAMAPDSRFPLVLAEKRTKRPDILHRFRMYRDGWDITNKHYWAVSNSKVQTFFFFFFFSNFLFLFNLRFLAWMCLGGLFCFIFC